MKRRTFLRAVLAAVSFVVSGVTVALRAAVAPVSRVSGRRRTKALVLMPLPNWNKTTDDIDCNEYLRRVQDYERSLLPPDIVFPRTGQIWEAVRDCEVPFIAWIPRLIFPGGKARLRQGERVRILTLDDPKPLQVTFQSVRYHELHESIVPQDIRSQPDYTHYVLSLRTARTAYCLDKESGYFNELFRPVSDIG